MWNGEDIYDRADRSVRIEILKIRSDLAGRWRPVKPEDLGLVMDDWLKLSAAMVERFAKSLGEPVSMSKGKRQAFHKQRLIEFVVALADLGDTGIAAANPGLFKAAGK